MAEKPLSITTENPQNNIDIIEDYLLRKEELLECINGTDGIGKTRN
jgi:hypothetical protein